MSAQSTARDRQYRAAAMSTGERATERIVWLQALDRLRDHHAAGRLTGAELDQAAGDIQAELLLLTIGDEIDDNGRPAFWLVTLR